MSRKIIIADDDFSIHTPLAILLKRSNYDVEIVGDGQAALAKIKSGRLSNQPFDLLITDIEMPRMTGLELIDELIQEKIFMPVLVVTGFGNKSLLCELKKRGCSDYLEKPIDERTFLKNVNQILGT